MSPLPVIHIGLPKTATTTLQEFLFPRHPQIEYLGKFGGNVSGRRYRDKAVQTIVDQTLRDNVFAADVTHCRELFVAHVAPAMDEGRVPVWSSEDLTAGSRERRAARAKNLRDVFGPSKIVLTLRQPSKFIESMYLRKLRGPHLPKQWKFGRAPEYFELGDWLEKAWHGAERGALSYLDFAKTAELFAEEFGQENVGIFLFEDLVAGQDEFIAQLCRFMGVDEEAGVKLVQSKRSNDRWTMPQLENLQKIAASPWRRTLYRFAPRSLQQRMLRGGLSQQELAKAPKAKAALPPKWHEIIGRHLAEGYARLQARWRLPLAQHGYPLPEIPSARHILPFTALPLEKHGHPLPARQLARAA